MSSTQKLTQKSNSEQPPALSVNGTAATPNTKPAAAVADFAPVNEFLDTYPDYDTVQEDSDSGNDESILVQIRKPKRDQAFWIHPSMHGDFDLLVDPDDEKIYRPVRRIMQKYCRDLKRFRLAACITPTNAVFLWPISQVRNTYSDSAIRLIGTQHSRWISCRADQQEKAYRFAPINEHKVPAWPTADFNTLVSEAFVNQSITSEDHPLLMKLRRKGHEQVS